MTHVNTYEQHVRAFDTSKIYTATEHMFACLQELLYSVTYSRTCAQVVEIEVQRIRVRKDGYTRSGAYWGVGAASFDLCLVYDDGDLHWHGVRAVSRPALRVVLKRLFPHAKVGR